MGDGTLTRADLCEAVHEEVGLTRQDCAMLIERTLELVAEALEQGATVKLSGFGVFQVRAKRERIGRNPKTGERVDVPAKRVPYFKPSKELRDLVNPGEVRSTRKAATVDVHHPPAM